MAPLRHPDRRQVPHPGRIRARQHSRQKRPHPVEDAADVDLHQAVPIGNRGVPEVAELFDAGVVDQQTHRAEIPLDGIGQTLQRVGVADVAHRVDGFMAGVAQFAPKSGGDGTAIDIGEYDRHSETRGVPRQPADAGAAPVMTAIPPRTWLGRRPRCQWATAFAAVLNSANGTELSVSMMRSNLVKTRPSGPRLMPVSRTPLLTANGTWLATWVTKM